MRWGHHISPVMMAPLRSAALCLIALLALGSPSWAQEPGKSDPKATGTKPDNAKPDTAKESIEWKPDKKLDWDKFKGGKPKKADHDAETYAFIQRSYECKVNGEYSFDAHAEFVPAYSTVDPEKKSPGLLAHEQIHFDIWQKHAAEFHKKLGEILKEKCKCNRSVADERAMKEAISAAWRAATQAADAENKKYDDETNHGQKDKEQQEWAEKIAKDLGQPVPKAPPAPAAPKDGADDGSDKTPKAEKPAACKDCEAAEAERKKKLADLKTQISALNTEHSTLFKQVDAIQRDIDAANAEKGKAKTDAAKKAADGKIKAAEGKQAPIKTKMEEVDKKRSELEQQAIPLEQPTHCPKCPANTGDSSFEPPPGDEFAGGPVKGHGDFCSPPQETYIPGTPGQFSEQYASEIPGNETPGEFVSYSVPFASDSTAYCTFGEGTSVPGYSVSTGDDGSSAPPSSDGGTDQAGTPAGPGTKIATGNPKTPLDDPPAKTPKPEETPTPANPTPTPTETPKRAETPTPTPITPTETPKTPDQPPPTKTTDNPPPDIPTTTDTPPVTIFIKASETVLEGSETGEPIQGQIIKLVMKEKPALPTTTENRTAMDKGFDKPAPQCTTAGDGQCRVDIPAEDRSLYALKDPPRTGGKPLNNYRLAINVMNHTGGVAETTGKQVPAVNETTSKGDVTAELFRIGNRTFVRLGFNTPSGVTNNFVKKYSGLLGMPIEVDICLIKEPGPPLGSEPVSYGAINQELPASVIRLRPASARVSKR